MENVTTYLPLLLQGLRMTLLLAVSTLVVGLALGMAARARQAVARTPGCRGRSTRSPTSSAASRSS